MIKKITKLNDRAFLSMLTNLPIQTSIQLEHIEKFWQNVIDNNEKIEINIKVHPSYSEKITNLASLKKLIMNTNAMLDEVSAIKLKILYGLVANTYPLPITNNKKNLSNKLYSNLSNSQRRFFQNLEIIFDIEFDENIKCITQTNYYTDGSFYKNKCTIGTSFLIKRANSKRDGMSFVFGGVVNRKYQRSGSLIAEVHAIKEAIKDALKHKYTDIVIHTDSLVCISYLNNNFESRNKYLQELKSYITNLGHNIKITFVKVKGHSITKEHNIVDEFARDYNKENSLSSKKYRTLQDMDNRDVITIYENYSESRRDYLQKTIYIPHESEDLTLILRDLNKEYIKRHFGQKTLSSNRELINKFDIKIEKFETARKMKNYYVVSIYDKLYELIY